MDDPLIGQQLANYQILRLIGRGGMASVYYGLDVRLERPVAIKIVDARYYWGDTAPIKRLIEEARLIATWRHENIAQVYYAGDQDGLYYYVMEFVDGQDLAQILAVLMAAGERMPYQEVLRIGRSVAKALDYAHQKGVVHRDVKPSNVLVAKDGRVVLSDFGLALDLQRGSQGQAFGTPHYIAPEQARRSSDAVPQSDLYSLGVMLFEMLTGTVPFDDPSPATVALQHLSAPIPPPTSLNPALPRAVDAVLERALSKDPADRYASGEALLDALEAALAAGPTDMVGEALPPPPVGVIIGADQIAPSSPRASIGEKLAQLTESARVPEKKIAPQASSGIQRLTFAALVLLIVIIFLSWFWYRPGDFFAFRTWAETLSMAVGLIPAPTETATLLPTAVGASLASVTATFSPTSTNTPSPSPTLKPSSTASAIPTYTPTLTPTKTGTSTLTPTPTETLTPSQTATLTPTITPTFSRRFLLFYDYNSLYLLNLSGTRLDPLPLAFERLASDGSVLNRFDGRTWWVLNTSLGDHWCYGIEIRDSEPYLRPEDCSGMYAAISLPYRSSTWIFWTYSSEGREFRVLWYEEEIARCLVGSGACEFYLP